MAFVRGLLGLMLFFAGMRIMSGALRGAATERVRVWLAPFREIPCRVSSWAPLQLLFCRAAV